ncbi:MAG: hypothetical protein N4A74_25515 [Carboxylicivirga sp.]|jgi:hypothetical protein|nr:hypothetical protein [Carboxylicivirga sp.]
MVKISLEEGEFLMENGDQRIREIKDEAIESKDDKNVTKKEKTELEQIGSTIGKKVSHSIQKNAKSAKADERVIANPDTGFKPKYGKRSPTEPEVKPEVSGLKKDQEKVDIAGVKKEEEQKPDDHVKQQKPGAKKPSEKKNENQEEGQATGEKPSIDNQDPKETNVNSLGEASHNAVGIGKEMKNMKDLEPTHNIGRQKRELLANDQQVVSLDIDKKEWLKAKPDKNGNLHVSLYDPDNPNDKFNKTVLEIPVNKVKMMEPDQNGRIKLMVAEEKPGHRKSAVQVYQDTPTNREKLVHKNPNVLNDTPELQKERVMNKPLEHGFYGNEMDVTMKDIHNQMKPENQKVIDNMPVQNLKEFIKDPETIEKYTMYEDLYQKDKEAAINKGMPVEVPGEAIGKPGEQVTVSVKPGIDTTKADMKVLDVKGQEYDIKNQDLYKGIPSPADDEKIKTNVVKDVSEAIESTPMNKIVDRVAEKIDKGFADDIKNMRLTNQLPVNDYNVTNDDVTKFREKIEEMKQGEKEVKVTEKVDIEAQKKEALETPVTDKHKYKDVVDKMTPSDQGDITKKAPEEIKDQAKQDAPEIKKNEQNISEGNTIKKTGQRVDPPTIDKQFSKAIVNNDKKTVTKLLEEGHKPGQNHVKLMKEMKETNTKLDTSIETKIKAAVPAPNKSMKI